ncbi:jg15842 [Pararge aegeria aegeria]|uniref:Jg15842 protein n=1 Tax=Pararge aegeria aegeria TaxID=348720 RepID=A0A8S4SG78_9NEOP|nr:jg15842 [Pararge aegeria aegeria]
MPLNTTVQDSHDELWQKPLPSCGRLPAEIIMVLLLGGCGLINCYIERDNARSHKHSELQDYDHDIMGSSHNEKGFRPLSTTLAQYGFVDSTHLWEHYVELSLCRHWGKWKLEGQTPDPSGADQKRRCEAIYRPRRDADPYGASQFDGKKAGGN